MKRVIFAGAIPPPLHGQSYVNKEMMRLLADKCDLRVLNIGAESLDRSNISYHIGRIKRVLHAAFQLSTTRAPDWRFYMSAEGGLGQLYMILLVAIARAKGVRIFFHYHSFSFVERRSRLMSAVARFAGRRAVHIFLCASHRDGFQAHYPHAVVARIVSNAWILPPSAGEGGRTDARRIRVGLISLLAPQKGLLDFIELMDRIRSLDLPNDGILAGPPVTPDDKAQIEGAVARLRPFLDYRGPVYGDDKVRFFRDIDVLIFPTRYAVETQPMVMFEAFSYGRPVITFARGCIEGDAADSGSLVVPANGDFVGAALGRLQEWLNDPEALVRAQQAALVKSRIHHDSAFAGRDAILQEITA
jgi:glycosyltransferase involved in cell wall biosynthesis